MKRREQDRKSTTNNWLIFNSTTPFPFIYWFLTQLSENHTLSFCCVKAWNALCLVIYYLVYHGPGEEENFVCSTPEFYLIRQFYESSFPLHVWVPHNMREKSYEIPSPWKGMRDFTLSLMPKRKAIILFCYQCPLKQITLPPLTRMSQGCTLWTHWVHV